MFKWSIGIYKGPDPLHLAPAGSGLNPALTADDVTDVHARYIADPFMIHEKSRWFMFFEVLTANGRGEIGLATSADGFRWCYEKIVLREKFHLSYPQVFRWRDSIYMIPETKRAAAVRLYRAVRFPYEWQLDRELIQGTFIDPSLVRFDDTWWLFVGEDGGRLHLLYADELEGRWTSHPGSPVIAGNIRKGRPGGRVLPTDDGLFRFAQDAMPFYGSRVRGFKIDQLSRERYHEYEVGPCPVLGASMDGWNGFGMHHIDAHKNGDHWLACVDGCTIEESSLRRILPQKSSFNLCLISDGTATGDVDGRELVSASLRALAARGLNPQSAAIHLVRVRHSDCQGICLGQKGWSGATVHDILIDRHDRFFLEAVQLFLWSLDLAVRFDTFHTTSEHLYKCCLAVVDRNGPRPILGC